jgi:putative FmdB family regulatory protein
MPIYEYVCSSCGNYEERLEFGSEVDREHVCPSCNKQMDRIVSQCRFKLIYNNKTDVCSWGNEGYASSQYWKAYKEAKARGEDVKPAGED